jgi:hypothetical protein
MAFKAANPTPCIKCPVMIAKGEPITWTRGKGAMPGVYHVVCPQDIPAGITIDPMVAVEPSDTSGPLYDFDEDLPPIEPEPLPGTRRWLREASIPAREEQLAIASIEAVTHRDFIRLTIRYTTGLDSRDTARMRRYARGLWDGRIASGRAYRAEQMPDLSAEDQLELQFAAPTNGESEHSRATQMWRELIPVMAGLPA